MSFRKCVMRPAHNTPHSADFVFRTFGERKQRSFLGRIDGCRRVWKVVGTGKLKTECSAADGFKQECPPG
jgi:hypothetical protein